MIKQITSRELRPGMFIHDLNCGWMEHPFLRKQFKLESDKDIATIVRMGIREIYIDTARGLDVPSAPTEAEVRRVGAQELLALAKSQPGLQRVSHEEELSRARNVRNQAHQAVTQVMQDVRLGRAVKLERIEPVVENITGSILRNSGALLGLMHIKSKDDYTFLHSVAVCALMVAFSRHAGLDAALTRQAGIGGLLHDVGKAGIADSILNKPGRLTEEELSVMRKHPEDGFAILQATPGIGEVPLTITLQHHERVDGSGYPYNLAGDDIHRLAQMAAIVDVYDALTSRRPYHDAVQPTEALSSILQWSKLHFNPELVQMFVRCIGIYPVGTLVRLESERLALVTEQNPDDLLRPEVKVIYSTTKRSYITPEVVDLARPMGRGGADAIAGHETASAWGIETARFA
jgi:HD-GYP domain-containing protein (c-di-GMP phosphodiesterase class II)